MNKQGSRQTGHFVLTGFLVNHSLIASWSKTWKQVVTADVTGEMGSDKIGHDSSALDASSAISQAIRLGIALSGTIVTGAGAGAGGGISRGGGWVVHRISSVRSAVTVGSARL